MMKFKATNMLVLGLLKSGPMNGYEIQQKATTTTNLFWSELKYGHIYPALQALAKDHYIAIVKKRDSEQVRKSTTYEITPKGRQFLSEWVEEDECKDLLKNETLAKIFFSSPQHISLQTKRINQLFLNATANLQVLQTQKEHIQAAIQQNPEKQENLTFQMIVLEFGLHYFNGLHELSEKCKNLLANLSPKQSEHPEM